MDENVLIILFIQIISVFCAAGTPVYLTSIFAESVFAVTVGFLSFAFLILFVCRLSSNSCHGLL